MSFGLMDATANDAEIVDKIMDVLAEYDLDSYKAQLVLDKVLGAIYKARPVSGTRLQTTVIY